MQRPTVVTVFGILNIVFAVLGVLGALFTLFVLKVMPVANNPVLQWINENAILMTWTNVSIALGVAAAACLLAAGIGLLMMKRWARVLSIAYGIYTIIAGVIGVVLTLVLLCKPLLDIDIAGKSRGPEIAGAIGGAVGGTIGSCGGCFGLIYPILLIIFMTRPRVVAAFQSPLPPPPLPLR